MRSGELGWCLGYGILLAALTSIPYAVAFSSEGDDWGFTGSVFAVEDGNSYIAKMRLGAEGAWLFRSPYSAQPQTGIPAFLPYLLLGKLAGGSPSHRTLVLLYHALRVLAVPLAAVASYRFLAMWLDSVRWRRWATILATLGGGLGWALLLIGRPGIAPLEFYSPEAFGFLALYGIPHLALARAALLLGLCWYLQAARRGDWGWRCGLAWLALVVLQPLALASAAAAVLALGIAQVGARSEPRARSAWRSWLKASAAGLLVPAPLVLYLAIAYTRDPTLQTWASQNRLPSPPLWHYLVSYLPLLPLAAFAAWLLRNRRQPRLLVAWPLLLIMMAYAPVGVQRRLVEGIWVCLVALSAIALEQLGEPRPIGSRLSLAVMLLSLPASLLLLAGGIQVARSPAEPAFGPAGELAAFGWLAEHAPAGSIVLAAFETGNALPAWAPVRVVIGHGPETAGLDRLRPAVQAFFRPDTPEAARQAILEGNAVSYVFHGQHERELGSWDPAQAEFLRRVFLTSEYAIFEAEQP